MNESFKDMNDEDLVKGCIEKHPIAQRNLYNKFSRKMFGVCLRYTNDKDEAEDVLQNGFIKVFENIGSFRGSGSLEGWIRRIMVNTALNHYWQNQQHKNNKVDLSAVEFKIEGSQTASSNIDYKELMQLIHKLPAGFRNVFNLFAIEGYSHKEIAEMMGISEGTSKSQYARARAFLQKLLLKENKININIRNEENYDNITWN